jgi:hypothetical protein
LRRDGSQRDGRCSGQLASVPELPPEPATEDPMAAGPAGMQAVLRRRPTLRPLPLAAITAAGK